jgi:hypothetical protein
MTDLTQDELTVLMIADQGESMVPIGRWAAPIQSLLAKGYMHANDKFNNVITEAGRQAVNHDETVVRGKDQARQAAEAIAVQLVDLAELSIRITGDNKKAALEKWSRQILTRALEMLR